MEKKFKILAIDDHPDVLYGLQRGLTSINPDYEVRCANGGVEALEKLKTYSPNLVLLDIMMPEVDGWAVAAKIRRLKKTARTPIIFITAKTDIISKTRGHMTAEEYMEKPVDIAELDDRITAIRKKYRLH